MIDFEGLMLCEYSMLCRFLTCLLVLLITIIKQAEV